MLVIDFGTTNTLVAEWSEAQQAPVTVRVPGLSAPPTNGMPPVIPSQVYIEDARAGRVRAGLEVKDGGLNTGNDPRFFSGFKRAIAAQFRDPPHTLDGVPVDAALAGELFLRRLLETVRGTGRKVDQLLFTVPVQAFEKYAHWLAEVCGRVGVQQAQIVDESTAAALGYQVSRSGSQILVFDFGGGTLDISVVRMPQVSGARPAGILVKLGRMLSRQADPTTGRNEGVASVLGKAGEILGGEDLDLWLLDDLLQREALTRAGIAGVYLLMKETAEATKIALSDQEQAEFSCFDPDALRTYSHTYTRSSFEDLLDRNSFFSIIQRALQSALRQRELRGLDGELAAVVLTGGTSQMPAVQRAVRQNFSRELVRAHKPFEAVAHGALQLTRGDQVEDFIYHSYGVRGWNSRTVRHEYDLIIPAGHRYPSQQPVERRYPCATYQQTEIELLLGEIDHGAAPNVVEVIERAGIIQTVQSAASVVFNYPTTVGDHVLPVNVRTPTVRLAPPGNPGPERIRALFRVDAHRTLHVTVDDLQTKRRLLNDQVVAQLR